MSNKSSTLLQIEWVGNQQHYLLSAVMSCDHGTIQGSKNLPCVAGTELANSSHKDRYRIALGLRIIGKLRKLK